MATLSAHYFLLSELSLSLLTRPPPTLPSRLLLQEASSQLQTELNAFLGAPRASDLPVCHVTPIAGTMLSIAGSWLGVSHTAGAQELLNQTKLQSKATLSPVLILVGKYL